MSWSATQYSLFEQQRTRPVRDLVAAIPLASAHTAVDLGCGPGNSTEVLAERCGSSAGNTAGPGMIAPTPAAMTCRNTSSPSLSAAGSSATVARSTAGSCSSWG